MSDAGHAPGLDEPRAAVHRASDVEIVAVLTGCGSAVNRLVVCWWPGRLRRGEVCGLRIVHPLLDYSRRWTGSSTGWRPMVWRPRRGRICAGVQRVSPVPVSCVLAAQPSTGTECSTTFRPPATDLMAISTSSILGIPKTGQRHR